MVYHALKVALRAFAMRLPSQCAVCHRWPAHSICEQCVEQFAQPRNRCSTCALPIEIGLAQCGECEKCSPVVDSCLTAVSYGYPWSNLIHEFKFSERTDWSRSFAQILKSAPWVEPELEAADVVLPIPLSRRRLAWRGYNQAQLLAHHLEPGKVVVDVLLRIKDTPPQSSLSRADRLCAVKDAFAIDPLQVHRVRGKGVILVDDVMTSGASLDAAAKVIRLAGATRITALVFARTN